MVPWNSATNQGSWNNQIMTAVCAHFKISPDKPYRSLTEKQRQVLLYGAGDLRIPMKWEARSGHGEFMRTFEGLIPGLLRRYKETASEEIREWIEGFMTQRTCPQCKGARFRKETLAVRIDGRSIAEISDLSIDKVKDFFACLALNKRDETIARQVMRELRQRLDFLINVGLSYITLSRAPRPFPAGSRSGSGWRHRSARSLPA